MDFDSIRLSVFLKLLHRLLVLILERVQFSGLVSDCFIQFIFLVLDNLELVGDIGHLGLLFIYS